MDDRTEGQLRQQIAGEILAQAPYEGVRTQRILQMCAKVALGEFGGLDEGSATVRPEDQARVVELEAERDLLRAEADAAEALIEKATEILNTHGGWYSGPLLYRTLCDALGIEMRRVAE